MVKPESPRTFALIGNPNCGKTTLFNGLTGLRQKVGNYPGVTVERKEGMMYSQHGQPIRIVDLPGAYSLQPRSPDERILVDVLLGNLENEPMPDGIICTIDASNLERNLFLLTQSLELGLPVIVALNMMDMAKRRGLRLDVDRLSKALGVPVVPIEALSKKGIVELKLEMSRKDLKKARSVVERPEPVRKAIADLRPVFQRPNRVNEALAEAEASLRIGAEEGSYTMSGEGPVTTRVRLWRQKLDREIPGWRSELITTRYAFIGDLVRDCVHRFNPNKPSRTEQVDRVLLHPVGGLAVLTVVMGLLFYSIFKLAVPFMDAIDWLITWIGDQAGMLLPEGDLSSLIVDGMIGGVGGVVIFLPQILMLFFFIGLLESTGYMARAAFILDRLMSKVGLHGRSFVPLLSSYACAVPGIMATRTIESFKDRLVTILVAPFMTCTARLPVYLVMIAAMLPVEKSGGAWVQAGILFLLYFIGTVAALVFGLIFKKTLLKGATPTMVMELPPYRIPQVRTVFIDMLDRAKVFLRRAGTVIFGLSIVLWFLMNYPKLPESNSIEAGTMSAEMTTTESGLEYSFAGRLGKTVEPVFEPLGYDWKISVGVIASFAAREIFVSTLAIIYNVDDEEDTSSLVQQMKSQIRDDGRLLFTPLTCLSLMIFFVFALQCLSTIAVVKRETNSWRWPIFQLLFMFVVAWSAAALVFQGGMLLGYR